jgi:7-dehydrocholesterol reductase
MGISISSHYDCSRLARIMSTLTCEPLIATTSTTKAVNGAAVEWGRKSKADVTNNVVALTLILFCPILLLLNSITLEQYGGSLYDAVASLSNDPLRFAQAHSPSVTLAEFIGYGAWILWQTALYTLLPGKQCSGQLTPGGYVLRYVLVEAGCANSSNVLRHIRYTTNGLFAWVVTHALFFALTWSSCIDSTIIVEHWEGLLVASNAYGFALAILVQIKGYLLPSFPEDRKLSGKFVVQRRRCSPFNNVQEAGCSTSGEAWS